MPREVRNEELKRKVREGSKFVALLLVLLLAWAPWVSDDFAVSRVVDKLGGSDAKFNYLGELKPVKEIPKQVVWFPFVKQVVFPGEAAWFVTFWGGVF